MNIQEPFVITLGREVGSGGHTVGSILASKLGVRYLDKHLLAGLKEQFNLTADNIERLKGEKKSWLSDILNMVTPVPQPRIMGADAYYIQDYRPSVTSDDIYNAEVEILQGMAQLGSCVIAGRSGFFVLKNHPNKLDVFITASTQHRVERIMAKQGLSEREARELVEGIDKARSNYIRRYAGVDRYDSRNYDLVINSDGHTEEQLADIIIDYIGGTE